MTTQESRANASQSPYEAKNLPDVILPLNAVSPITSEIGAVVAMGASTGGIQTLENILTQLIPPRPPILIVQHIPPLFSTAMAQRFNALSQLTIKEAEDGEPVLSSHVYIAPGDRHLMIQRIGRDLRIQLHAGPKVSRHRPSVDVLFRSFANEIGSKAVGIILTGMGDDGSIGMKEMYDRGAKTIAQSKETCTVFGMPKMAAEKGGVLAFLSPDQIAKMINELNRW